MTGWVETEVTRSHPHYQLLGELRNKPEGLLFPLLHSRHHPSWSPPAACRGRGRGQAAAEPRGLRSRGDRQPRRGEANRARAARVLRAEVRAGREHGAVLEQRGAS